MGQHNLPERLRRRRHVPVERGHRQPVEDRAGGENVGHEVFLHDAGARDRLRLFEEDLWDGGDVVGLVVAAAAPARDVLHRGVVGEAPVGRAGGDGRDGDAGLADGRDERGVGVLGVAVAQQDDVLDPGVGPAQRVESGLERGLVAHRIGRPHGLDRRVDRRLVRGVSQGDRPSAVWLVGPVGVVDLDAVGRGQQRDDTLACGLGDIDVRRRLEILDDEGHGHGGGVLALWQFHAHRQHALQRGAGVAADPVAGGAADDDETAAAVDVGGERRALGVEQRGVEVERRDVDQRHGVEAAQVGRRRLDEPSRLPCDVHPPGAQRRRHDIPLAGGALGHEHARRAAHVDQRGALVVLGDRICGRFQHGAQAVVAGSEDG